MVIGAHPGGRSARIVSARRFATLIDDEGSSARIGADHFGHAKVSMTQNVYMTRGRAHPQVAELLERLISDG